MFPLNVLYLFSIKYWFKIDKRSMSFVKFGIDYMLNMFTHRDSFIRIIENTIKDSCMKKHVPALGLVQ